MQPHERSADTIAFSDTQLQKLVGAVEALKASGFHWEAIVPVFVGSFLGFGLALVLEDLKIRREQKKKFSENRKQELTEINIATIALASNLEILIHFVFQNILPHYDDSHAAYKALKLAAPSEAEIAKFIQSLGNYPHMMMTAPELNFLEHDFFASLPFVIGKESEILTQANWMIHLSRILRKLLQDRNAQIELARSQGLKGVRFPEVGSTIQVQASLADTECVTILQLIEQIRMIAQTLELVGHTYKNAGTLSILIPPPVLHDALQRLRAISGPLEQAMPDRNRSVGFRESAHEDTATRAYRRAARMISRVVA